MTIPTAFGRKLPPNDWEGDGLWPWVTCMDHSVGRAVAWATSGRIVKDGAVYRHSVHPHDWDGINLVQAKAEVLAVAGLELVIKRHWPIDFDVRTHLKWGKGLVVIGWYDRIPRLYRHQDKADFMHALFVAYTSATGYARVYDALNPAIRQYGEMVPQEVIWRFMASGANDCGYVPLQPL